MEIFQTEKFDEKLCISLSHLKGFLRRIVGVDTASSQKFVAVLRTKFESRKGQILAIISAVRNHSLFAGSGKKKDPASPKGIHAVEIYAGIETHVAR